MPPPAPATGVNSESAVPDAPDAPPVSAAPSAAAPAPAGTEQSQQPWWRAATGQEIWERAKAAWPPPFRALFLPGALRAALDAAEHRLGAPLPPRARELLAACAGAGLPAAGASQFHAETCLADVASWRPPGALLGEAFEWDAATLAGHAVIGVNPEGADYGNPVLLRLEDGEVLGATLNVPELTPLGPFDRWVAEARPGGCGDPASMYIEDPEEDTPESVAARHGWYLGLYNSSDEADGGGVHGGAARVHALRGRGRRGGGSRGGGGSGEGSSSRRRRLRWLTPGKQQQQQLQQRQQRRQQPQ